MIKKDIEAVPFDALFLELTKATEEAKEQVVGDAFLAHTRDVNRRLKAIYPNISEYDGDREVDFPFKEPPPETYAVLANDARKAAFEVFAEKHNFKNHSSWMLPQVASFIAKMPIVRLSDGTVDSVAYRKQFNGSAWLKGLYQYCMTPLRGLIMGTQYHKEFANYSSLVPLLLMPHKRYNDVNYSEWSRVGLEKIVDKNLYEAITCNIQMSPSKEELLENRNIGLRYNSGKNEGSFRSPLSTHKLYKLPEPYKGLPWLAQVMLFQVWCAHPVNRTNLMILDWNNWDNMPEPLIIDEVTLATRQKQTVVDMPWDE